MVNIEKISEATWFKFTARGSMFALPIVLVILGVVAADWLDRVFRAQETAFLEVRSQIADIRVRMQRDEESKENMLTRIVTLEVSSTQGRAEQLRFQEQMLDTLKDINSGLVRLGERTAGVEAALNAMKDRAELGGVSHPKL